MELHHQIVSYLGHSLRDFYPWAELQLVYSTAPPDWAIVCLLEIAYATGDSNSGHWSWKGKVLYNLILVSQKCMECFRLLFDHLSWIEHQILSGIRDSRKAGSLWGMMRGVGGVRKSTHQSWLAKGLGLGLLCWGFKGVQEEILPEESSILQIGSVAFPTGQCTSRQLHPCHSLFDQVGHQDSCSQSL